MFSDYWKSKSKDLRVQYFPFPVYPFEQVHTALWSRTEQVAYWWQGLALHGSGSEKKTYSIKILHLSKQQNARAGA